jgi:hypothetical protein
MVSQLYCYLNYLAPAEDSEVRMVDQTGGSLNQIERWLRLLERLSIGA